jgi:hypothetical protein
MLLLLPYYCWQILAKSILKKIYIPQNGKVGEVADAVAQP